MGTYNRNQADDHPAWQLADDMADSVRKEVLEIREDLKWLQKALYDNERRAYKEVNMNHFVDKLKVHLYQLYDMWDFRKDLKLRTFDKDWDT